MTQPKSGIRFWLKNKKQRRILITAYFFLLPTLIIMGIFLFLPMIQAFIYSFQEYSLLSTGKFIGLENYKRLIHDEMFLISLKNSILYLLVVPIIAFLSFLLAVLVDRRIRGINFFRICYYVPVVTSMIVVGIVWKQLMLSDESGYLNHILLKLHLIKKPVYWLTSVQLALPSVMFVTIWKGLGYYMVIFLAGLRTIPNEVIEASVIDGAKRWQQVFFIKFPLLKPTFYLVMIISSIAALKVFEEIFVMTKGNPSFSTSTIVWRIYRVWVSENYNMGYTSAMGVILFFITLIFSILSTMYIVKEAKK
jgi:putative chitobiose transport system permease protein